MRSFKDNLCGMVDLGVVLMIGIAFVGLMVVAYIVWTIDAQLTVTAGSSADQSLANVTGGFDDAVNLLLIAIVIFILSIAISALLMLRGR